MPFQDLITSLKYHDCDSIEASVTHEKIFLCKALTIKSFLQKMCESPCSLYMQDNQWKEGVNKSMGFRPLLGYCRGSYFLPLSLFLHPTATMKSAGSITLSLRHRFHPHPHCSWIQKRGVQCDSCHLPPFQTGITLDLSHLIAFTSPPPVELPPLSTSHTVPPNHERRVMSRSTEKRKRGRGRPTHRQSYRWRGYFVASKRKGRKITDKPGLYYSFYSIRYMGCSIEAWKTIQYRYCRSLFFLFFTRQKIPPLLVMYVVRNRLLTMVTWCTVANRVIK